MSKKQWLVLLMLFLTYLLLGASIFYHIESRLEIEKLARAKLERIEINGKRSEDDALTLHGPSRARSARVLHLLM